MESCRQIWCFTLSLLAGMVLQACECTVSIEGPGARATPAAAPAALQPPSTSVPRPVLSDTHVAPAAPRSTTVRGGEVQVRGELPAKKTAEIIARHFGELRFCHETNPRVPDQLQVSLELEVSARGEVERADARGESSLDPTFAECLASASKRWSLPAPKKPGTATVIYPITFESAAR